MGPNVKILIIQKSSTDAVFAKGGKVSDVIAYLSDPRQVVENLRSATIWVVTAIAAVRYAAEPNLWKDATDEDIAGEILRKIQERDAARKGELK